MKRKEETMSRRIIVAMALIMIGIAIGLYWAHQQRAHADCMSMTQPAGWVAERKTIAAMRYHGVRSATSDSQGNLTFRRDGRICQLFTEGFLAQWEVR